MSHWPWLILAGGLTALAIYCVSSALVYAQVSFLAPFDICQFILNTLVGYVAFTEVPAPWAIWIVLAFVGFSICARKKWI
jgi:drug/metabolite transporter (DMT)-like permease